MSTVIVLLFFAFVVILDFIPALKKKNRPLTIFYSAVLLCSFILSLLISFNINLFAIFG